ncbi:MAG: efflux RND transporter periplasmic adaptor subunit [Candidatus Taylorbacteria bacterium]|nr:efflux RND transporter periplasmic adaptor subunit [Candidatus Taylorbacteria bacterium]
MKKHIHRIGEYVKKHKVLATIGAIILVAIIYHIWTVFHPTMAETSYILGKVQRGKLEVTVSGTGQVSASNQVDLKSKVLGDVIYVGVAAGTQVKAGTVIARFDARDATQDVREAQAALASAKISLQKAQISSDQTKDKTTDSLTKAYDNGYSTISNIFTDFPTVIADVNDIFYLRNHSSYMSDDGVRTTTGNSGLEKKTEIVSKYERAKTSYNKLFEKYKGLSRDSPSIDIEKMFDEAYLNAKNMADALKEVRTYIGYLDAALNERTTQTTTDKATLDRHIATVNSEVVNLLSSKTSIDDAKNARADAAQNYDGIASGISSGTLAVQTAELVVIQKQNTYQKALNTLSDYTITAPFDGIVAKLDVKQWDTISSNAVLGVIITTSQVANISLNELDAVKVKIGQKTLLTFDALEDVKISGEVSEIDSIGTVTQGVVTYNAKVVFDSQDSRVKPGMSVSAAIVIDSRDNALIVPTLAVKTVGSRTFVQTFVNGVVNSIPVKVSLSNDTQSEITSAFKEGDSIIVRTVVANGTKTTTTRTPSLFNIGGNANRTTGATRVTR